MNNIQELVSDKNVILYGLAGILGGLTLFAGDMLFFYNGEQADIMINLSQSSHERIIGSGVTALVAAWLYTLGAGQIYYAFKPAKRWIRISTFFSFAALMISFGIIHAAGVSVATSALNAVALGLNPDELAELAWAVDSTLRYIVYVPVAIFSVLFIWNVWIHKTLFPRWVIPFCPIIPFLLLGEPISAYLHGAWWTIIAGGFFNWIMVTFFLATTVALYRRN